MKLRIIVLDLDKSIRDLITLIARKKGHEVLAVSEPVFCPLYSDLEHSCHQYYACGDLMIIDNKMSKMSGLGLIRKQIKGGCKGAAQNKLVIFTTGTKGEEFQIAKRLGCKIVNYPIRPEEISKWIDECEEGIDPNRRLADLV